MDKCQHKTIAGINNQSGVTAAVCLVCGNKLNEEEIEKVCIYWQKQKVNLYPTGH
jgi:hypothetical protein